MPPHQIKPIVRLVLSVLCCSSSIITGGSADSYPPHAILSEYGSLGRRTGKPLSSPWHWRTLWGDGHTIPGFPTGPSAPHQNLDQPNSGQGRHGTSLSFRRKSGERRFRRQSDNHKGGQDARKEIDVTVAFARDTPKCIQVSTSRDPKVVPITDQPR